MLRTEEQAVAELQELVAALEDKSGVCERGQYPRFTETKRAGIRNGIAKGNARGLFKAALVSAPGIEVVPERDLTLHIAGLHIKVHHDPRLCINLVCRTCGCCFVHVQHLEVPAPQLYGTAHCHVSSHRH